MVLWLVGCFADQDDEVAGWCDGYTDVVEPESAVVDDEDDCGTFYLELDAYLAVNVFNEVEQTECEAVYDAALDLPYEPAYTNMSNDKGPKHTFQVFGIAETGDDAAAFDVTCADGTGWSGRFVVR